MLLYVKELDEGALHLADHDGWTLRQEIVLNINWTTREEFESGLSMLDQLGLLDDTLWTDQTEDGSTMLHLAVCTQKLSVIPFLLPPYGKSDPTAVDHAGHSSLWYATVYGVNSSAVSALEFATEIKKMQENDV